MVLRRLDRTGHTELTDLSSDEMIRELERDMNTPGNVAIAEAPGKPPEYLRDAKSVAAWPEKTTVTVMPQLRGGRGNS